MSSSSSPRRLARQGLCMNKEWGKTRRSFGRMAVLEATTPHKGAPDGVYACPRCTCNA